jgi:hypothetical protein
MCSAISAVFAGAPILAQAPIGTVKRRILTPPLGTAAIASEASLPAGRSSRYGRLGGFTL